MTSTFEEILNGIIKDLNAHKRDKAKLMEYYVNERLNKSLKTYYEEMDRISKYLADKDALNVARKLNKEEEI